MAEYLLIRLKQIGIDHLFGVPGDFVLGFLNEVLESEVRYIGTCNELNAAYAADGYARLKSAGAYVTTYAVGELSTAPTLFTRHRERGEQRHSSLATLCFPLATSERSERRHSDDVGALARPRVEGDGCGGGGVE